MISFIGERELFIATPWKLKIDHFIGVKSTLKVNGTAYKSLALIKI